MLVLRIRCVSIAMWCGLWLCGIAGVFISPVSAEPQSEDAWVQTSKLPASEAHQAAAADTRFVYAISSTQVAKYDRHTRQRVAVSTGEALHLNSGFFWNGQLYCAHSNYPRKPERSEIKVLDVETMRLSRHQDFGDFGGSLTWVVRHEGSWWCNFAYYGDENQRTTLVRFNDDWQEQGRWTYPAEIIRQLGRYSLSGGIWRGDELLVTGHDDRALFRLRLPKQGNVLEFLGRQSVPFTGQGIAHDPRTGGLVGIDRGQRQVVFASRKFAREFQLRVLSYNIHHAAGVDGRLDLERIAKVIRSVNPDVVALQEIDSKVPRSGSVDQPAELARLTNMHGVFGDNIELNGGHYGNVVLSRFPIRRSKNHLLPRVDNSEQRGVLEVEIDLPENRPTLLLLATHLDYRPDDRERLASARKISELIASQLDRPALLAGDLNDVPDSATLAEFGKHWQRSNVEPRPTIPVKQPTRQIDFILYRPSERWRVVETQVLDEAVASDHRAILAVFELLHE